MQPLGTSPQELNVGYRRYEDDTPLYLALSPNDQSYLELCQCLM